MDTEQRAELFQIYVMERQDIANGQIVVFAIIAAALTYIVASAGFLIAHYTDGIYKDVPSVILLGSPLVTLALLSSLVVTVSTNAMRVKHLKKLEALLSKTVATNISLPSAISDFADIWEIRRKLSFLRVYTVLSLATYLPIFAVSLGYIFAVLIPGPWPAYKKAVFALYCFALAMQVMGILVASLHKRFRTDFITPA
jgi:hypothetical protein